MFETTQHFDLAELGPLAKKIRQKCRVSQAHVAKSVGVGIRFLSEFENGKPTCQIDKVRKIINFLPIKLSFSVKNQQLTREIYLSLDKRAHEITKNAFGQ